MWSDVRAAFKVALAIRTAANKIAQVMLGKIFKWKFNEIFLDRAYRNDVNDAELDFKRRSRISQLSHDPLRQKSCYVNRLRGASPLRQNENI